MYHSGEYSSDEVIKRNWTEKWGDGVAYLFEKRVVAHERWMSTNVQWRNFR